MSVEQGFIDLETIEIDTQEAYLCILCQHTWDNLTDASECCPSVEEITGHLCPICGSLYAFEDNARSCCEDDF